ncbi:MAG TPA: hypothetical protein DEP28_08080 [Bacteroidetes bacterium]|nr:hypothetical protein [Bacteroidota bacterium]HCN38445.1 hypothetical protein [Bacteroidota bacterium]
MCEFLKRLFGKSDINNAGDTEEDKKAKEAKMLPINPNEWDILSYGSGEVKFANGAVNLKPKAATKCEYGKDNEYGAWIISKIKVKNFIVNIEVNNIRQLRKNLKPRNFEVFWFFFNYIPLDNLMKNTNYFIHKMDTGIEIGRAFEEYGQEFLSTPQFSNLQLNKWYKYTFIKREQKLSININDVKVFEYDYSKNEISKQLLNESGHIGIYTEDAEVEVRNFSLIPL